MYESLSIRPVDFGYPDRITMVLVEMKSAEIYFESPTKLITGMVLDNKRERLYANVEENGTMRQPWSR